jgi:hypothetical protein
VLDASAVSAPPLIRSAAPTSGNLATSARIVNFYHAAFFSPSVATFADAVRKGFVSLPGLTADLILAHQPASVATAKGHLDQARRGQHSTRELETYDTTTGEWHHLPKPSSPRPSAIVTRIIGASPIGRIHSDLAGRFPTTAKSGAQYMLIMYSEEANYIHVECLRSRQASDFVTAYDRGIKFWTQHGIIPTFGRMDNESSSNLEDFCRTHSPPIAIQYVPPGTHRANKAERAIRTWKDHFIAGLATTDPAFPLAAWDELVPQAELTLNLLRVSSVSPYMSAWHQLHGPYDFSATPIAPPGMKIVSHEKPKINRATWAPHGQTGFYVGPAMSHYRCFRVWITATNSIRVTDTLSWHPIPLYLIPGTSATDDLLSVLTQLQASLTRLASNQPDLLEQRQPIAATIPHITASISALASIFNAMPARSVLSKGDLASPSTKGELLDFPTQSAHSDANADEFQLASHPQPSFSPFATPATSPDSNSNLSPTPRFSTRMRRPPDRLGNFVNAAADQTTLISSSISAALTHKDEPSADHPCSWRRHLAGSQHYSAAASMQDAFAMNKDSQPLRYIDTKTAWDKDLWRLEESKELFRLLRDTPTMKFIDPASKPANRIASYYNPQAKVKTKDGLVVRRIRGTYGGNISDFNGARSAQTADMQTVKLLLNAVISEDAHFMTADIKDFYLGTPLPTPEYMWIKRGQLPADIVAHYANAIIWHHDSAMVEISQGIYGLPQAGRLAQEKLSRLLALHGYTEAPSTPCLYRHATRPIAFTLVVDDFAIKYRDKTDAEHLLQAIREGYELTTDWSGSKYLGMSVNFGPVSGPRTVTISMPGYVRAALTRFRQPPSTRLIRAPAIYTPPNYGSKVQYADDPDDPASPLLDPARTTFIQEVIGVFLYYARAVDATMLTTLSKLASRQSHPTEALYTDVIHFLGYAACYPNAAITYHASDMQLIIHSDASYLSESNSRSRAGGIHFLARRDNPSQVNGAIDIISCIIPAVVAAASEAEYAALFLNGQTGVGLRSTLADLGYPQSATPIIADNTTACGIANRTSKIRKSKAIDMRFHWIRDRVAQGQFVVTWQPGGSNLADYFTKTHPAHHYVATRPLYIEDPSANGWTTVTLPPRRRQPTPHGT